MGKPYCCCCFLQPNLWWTRDLQVVGISLGSPEQLFELCYDSASEWYSQVSTCMDSRSSLKNTSTIVGATNLPTFAGKFEIALQYLNESWRIRPRWEIDSKPLNFAKDEKRSHLLRYWGHARWTTNSLINCGCAKALLSVLLLIMVQFVPR